MEKQVELKFGGIGGAILVGICVLIAGVKFLNLSDNKSENLHTDLKMRIGHGMGENIDIQSARVSSPLLSFSNNQEVVIRVTYKKDGISKPDKYLRYLKRFPDTWEHKGVSSSYSYYLNFM